jgi:hypothetical protein
MALFDLGSLFFDAPRSPCRGLHGSADRQPLGGAVPFPFADVPTKQGTSLVRFGAHNGLKPDIARWPKSASSTEMLRGHLTVPGPAQLRTYPLAVMALIVRSRLAIRRFHA